MPKHTHAIRMIGFQPEVVAFLSRHLMNIVGSRCCTYDEASSKAMQLVSEMDSSEHRIDVHHIGEVAIHLGHETHRRISVAIYGEPKDYIHEEPEPWYDSYTEKVRAECDALDSELVRLKQICNTMTLRLLDLKQALREERA